MSVRKILVEAVAKYSVPQRLHGEDSLRLTCSVSFVEGDAVRSVNVTSEFPEGLRELWEVCEEAVLFGDVDYGQWGLRLLTVEAATALTREIRELMPDDVRDGDLVVGEFLGDSEFLICETRGADAGRLLISLPLYSRDEWYLAADGMEEFLRLFIDNQGRKFWE